MITKTPELRPYHHFSHVYDEYLAHVDYTMWADYILKLWHKQNRNLPRSIVDIACGTGEMITRFLEKGITCDGIDISPEMVKIAEEKIKKAGYYSSRLKVVDMIEYSPSEKYTLCCCNFDSINYLKGENSLKSFLINVNGLLENDGMFIFDAATPYLCSEYYDRTTETEQIDKLKITRESRYDQKNDVLETDFIFKDEKGVIKKERHVQTIFAYNEIAASLEESGFKQISTYADFSLRKGFKKKSMRLHFVAGK